MKDEITIEGVLYIRKDTQKAEDFDGMEYKIIRTKSAGVFAAYVESFEGQEATIRHARRIWKWVGAASLSELAVEGVKRPSECKFPVEVDKIILTDVIEHLDCTQKAKDSIKAVKIWTAH